MSLTSNFRSESIAPLVEGKSYRLTLRTRFGPSHKITGSYFGLLHDEEIPDEPRLDTYGFEDMRDSAGIGYGGLEVSPRDIRTVEPL